MARSSLKYRAKWEEDIRFKDWLRNVEEDIERAYCRFCDKELSAKLSTLEDHMRTSRHQQQLKRRHFMGMTPVNKCFVCSADCRPKLIVSRKEELPVPASTWDEFIDGNLQWTPEDKGFCEDCLKSLDEFHAIKVVLAEKRRSVLNQLQQKRSSNDDASTSGFVPPFAPPPPLAMPEVPPKPKKREPGRPRKPRVIPTEPQIKVEMAEDFRIDTPEASGASLEQKPEPNPSVSTGESTEETKEKEKKKRRKKPKKESALKVSDPVLLQHCKPINVTRFSCCSCPRAFDTEREFLFHYELVHSEQAGDANRLELMDDATDAYQKDEKPFVDGDDVRCRFCNISFSSKAEFDKHAMNTHGATEESEFHFGGELVESNSQGAAGTSEGDSKQTARSGRRPHVCTVGNCKRRYDRLKQFQIHLRKTHKMVEPSICPVCDKIFPEVRPFLDHIREHDAQMDPVGCDHCKAVFQSHHQLVSHHREKHQKKTFRCKYRYCVEEYFFAKERDAHVQCHESERPHQCQLCAERYENSRAANLWAHNNQFHSTDDRYKCKICHRRLGSQSALRRHRERIHDRIKKYSCETCGKSFTYPDLLRRHMPKVDGNIVLNDNPDEEGILLDWSDDEDDAMKKLRGAAHHSQSIDARMQHKRKRVIAPPAIKGMVGMPRAVEDAGSVYMLLEGGHLIPH
ncbi:unnamed protein product [Cyprideis torosa]|uniref:Uncharacterized protein n=1 Tax=Cyprideis torosa TaxID=163714 RepID=A0A7R8WJ87_9CRUS|nr:unnamed protein product [Cyprideis torosa]CAG0901646.1 unnamed protein product [Cyprideis torosa]